MWPPTYAATASGAVIGSTSGVGSGMKAVTAPFLALPMRIPPRPSLVPLSARQRVGDGQHVVTIDEQTAWLAELRPERQEASILIEDFWLRQ